jgi:ribonuclease HII
VADSRRIRGTRQRRRGAPLTFERELWSSGVGLVAGVDEAGRGPLAGPVVAAAVVFRPEQRVPGVTDSKQLPAREREALALAIRRRALCIGIGAASCVEIDRLNILRATHLAMRRALARLPVLPDHVLVDGLPVRELGPGHTAIVDGDARSFTIACASIMAKTTRDRLMRRLAARYPAYGWETNVGYGTPEHVAALGHLGPTPHHRRSFVPVQLSLEIG